MRVRVTDTVALQSARPRNIRLYLQTRGWERIGSAAQPPDVWALPTAEGTYEVIAPSSRTTLDYAERVAELLRTLSIVEDRSEQDVLRDMLVLDFDIQYIHTWHPGPHGTAPLRDAANALNAAHGMLEAAAASLEEPRLVLPSRRPSSATSLMRNVRAGPTEAGSYVISMWVPIPPRLTPEEDSVLFDERADPFERAATRRLHQALVATRTAAREYLDEDADLTAFSSRVSDGVSANLCESLVLMGGNTGAPFDVHFTWALARPFLDAPRLVSFDDEIIPVLDRAAYELRASVPEDEVRVRGAVIRLHREGDTGPGDVTIAGVISGEPADRLRRVAVSLSAPDYQRAIEAHQAYSDVEVAGSLYRRGTRTYLQSARGFAVLPDPEAR